MYTILDKSDPAARERLVAHLRTGAIAIMPCDTIYGLVGIAPDAEHALRHAKGRPDTKPFIELVRMDRIDRIAASPVDPAVLALWPGPLTAIVSDLNGGTTAIRVPADPFLDAVLADLDAPLYSTSVNISGEPAFTVFDEMVARFSDVIGMFVRGDDRQGTVPSTIVDISTDPYTLVRQGVMDVTDLIGGTKR